MSDIEPAPLAKPQTAKVVTIAAAHAAHDTYTAFLPPLLPVFIEKLSFAKAEAGLLTVFLQGPSPSGGSLRPSNRRHSGPGTTQSRPRLQAMPKS